jgi:hypothetical protein
MHESDITPATTQNSRLCRTKSGKSSNVTECYILSIVRKRILKPAFAFFFIVSVNIYIQFKTGINDPKFGDSQHYLLTAQAIYNGQEYLRVIEGWPFFRAPGYPFIISTLWEFTSYNSILVIKLFNSMCLGLLGLGIYMLAKRNLTENFSIVAVILATLNPFIFLQSLEVSTETITATLFVYFILLLTKVEFKSKGILLGLTIIGLVSIRPEYLFISATSIILYYSFLHFEPKKLITPVLLVAVSLSFWGLENKKATGNFIPLTNATSFQLWLGSSEFIYNNYPLKFQDTNDFSKKQFSQFIGEMEKVEKKYAFKSTVTDIPRQSDAWLSEYKHNLRTEKLDYIKNFFVKCSIFWRPFLNPSSYGPSLVLASFVILFPLMIFSLIGYILAIRRKIFYNELILLTNSLFILTMVHAIQMPDFRYRVPSQFPVMSLLTAYFFSIAVRKIFERRKSYRFLQ